MNGLPVQVLENILAHIPVVDLLKSCVLVCHSWNEIISRKKFIPWKKLYFSYTQHVENSAMFLKGFCDSYNITGAENCLQSLIFHFLEFRGSHVNTMRYLKSHPLFSLAEKIMNEQYQATSLWGITATICIISNDAWEMYRLFDLLAHSGSDFTTMEVMEKFYCLCTLFLYFHRKFRLPAKLHYNLRYALNLFENRWTCVPISQMPRQSSSQQQSAAPPLTHEQSRIVNHQIEKNHLIKIVAFAGSGKTTTLLRFTEKNPKTEFLLIVYNRAVSDEAGGKFPNNVTCRTIHQLAYNHIISSGFMKNKKTGNIFPTSLVTSRILPSDRPGLRRYQREKLVLDTLNRFWGSADDTITLDHTPTTASNKSSRDKGRRENTVKDKILTIDDRKNLVSDAKKVWASIKDPYDLKLKLPCDAYLKLWQLQKPNLFKTEKVKCVMVDEGQDLNGAMLDIFLRSIGRRIIVGDPHQQIYRWRYAVNALNKVPATHTFYLTQSFRFGPEIGFMANACLSVLNNVSDKCLVGVDVRDALSDAEDKLHHQMQNGNQICYLARTNLTLFKKVVEVLGCEFASNSQKPKPKISYAGGIKNMGLDLIIDVYHLWKGEHDKIVSRFLGNRKQFPNYAKFTEFVEATMDMEWGARIAQVNWAKSNTEMFVDAIRNSHVHISDADIVFSTAHKSKGMEWDTVVLLDDFIPTLVSGPISGEAQEERNLLYVAVTRAKRKLIINPACYYTLLAVGDRREKIVDSNTYLDTHGPIAICYRCQEVLPGQCRTKTASLVTTPLKIMTLNNEPAEANQKGILCTLCAGLHFYTFRKYSCYENELPVIPIKDDIGHLAFRFLVGPSTDELAIAEPYYVQQRLLMVDGFVRAQHLVQQRQPVVVIVNEQEDLFPDDDNVFLEVAAYVGDIGGNNEVMAPVRLNDQRQGVDVFPDDDDMFPMNLQAVGVEQPEIHDDDDSHRNVLLLRLSQ